ncbi:MAG: hypothetical protein Q4D81_15410 [Eubacteriales bacterium]|nr:hypothetical protein [Eubacteriales bacterium]
MNDIIHVMGSDPVARTRPFMDSVLDGEIKPNGFIFLAHFFKAD